MSLDASKIITHPSVRIKGTENSFVPKECTDEQCTTKLFHMHCPFCLKADMYQDPRILKAHYRVKHVDKGIDFAGLKILRCCEQCDIVGAIKGEKKFKGAHWHCYKCRNGFNRRDEAVKHYKTHFRHPYTTFQIHIPQEVTSAGSVQDLRDGTDELGDGMSSSIGSVLSNTTSPLTTAISTITLTSQSEPLLMNGDMGNGIHHSTSTSSEDVHSPNGHSAIVILKEDNVDGSSLPSIISGASLSESEDSFQEQKPQERVLELQEQLDILQAEKDDMEKRMRVEINRLKSELEADELEIKQLRSQEQELTKKLTNPLGGKLQQLLASLQLQHMELLQNHILQVKQEAYNVALKELQSSTILAPVESGSSSSASMIPGNDQTMMALVLDGSAGLLSHSIPTSNYGLVPATPPPSSATVTGMDPISAQTLSIALPLSMPSSTLFSTSSICSGNKLTLSAGDGKPASLDPVQVNPVGVQLGPATISPSLLPCTGKDGSMVTVAGPLSVSVQTSSGMSPTCNQPTALNSGPLVFSPYSSTSLTANRPFASGSATGLVASPEMQTLLLTVPASNPASSLQLPSTEMGKSPSITQSQSAVPVQSARVNGSASSQSSPLPAFRTVGITFDTVGVSQASAKDFASSTFIDGTVGSLSHDVTSATMVSGSSSLAVGAAVAQHLKRKLEGGDAGSSQEKKLKERDL